MKKVIVIGSGIAALSAIHALDVETEIICITKDKLKKHNSFLAQGGICFSKYEHDEGQSHIEDTFLAGNELGDRKVIQSIIQHSHDMIQQMMDDGMEFDKNPQNHALDFAMEGAHSKARILHAGGDQTGAHITQYLLKNLPTNKITFYENSEVIDLLCDDSNQVSGVIALDDAHNQITIEAHDVILATGGYSNLFPTHSGASNSMSSGHMIGYHHHLPLQHMEMIQFHPTLLGTNSHTFGLVSEAVRGHGGILVNELNQPFMDDIHPLGSLAPRDITSRALFTQQQLGHQCFINIEEIDNFPNRFPTIYKNVIQHFPHFYKKHRIPVTPGAHYTMGGIKSNIDGSTDLQHFYVIGEASSTNFHGANRLASNSLLEALVMGNLCGKSINQSSVRPLQTVDYKPLCIPKIKTNDLNKLSQSTFHILGIERNGHRMSQYLKDIRNCIKNASYTEDWTKEDWQRYVRIKTLEIVCLSALSREESRGVHYRTDFPNSQSHLQNTDIEIKMEDTFNAKQVTSTRETETILP